MAGRTTFRSSFCEDKRGYYSGRSCATRAGSTRHSRHSAAHSIPTRASCAVPDEPQVRGHLVEVLVEGLGKTYRERGRTNEALASYRRAAELLAEMKQKDPTDLYNLACCLAQCCSLAQAGEGAASATAPANDAARAVEALRRATEAAPVTMPTS